MKQTMEIFQKVMIELLFNFAYKMEGVAFQDRMDMIDKIAAEAKARLRNLPR